MVATLLSPHFKGEPPSLEDIKIASIIWGVTLGIGLLTAWKAIEQTIMVWRHKRVTRSWYIWMVWLLWIDNMVQGGVSWFFMNGELKPRYFESSTTFRSSF
jgi:hypothetical protein